ncbi:MAG: N-acetyl-gamma-glutamyl-phosphate reductase [Clostridia bacterium]|nr:N-acetyl-gamma-glutamyl-phosphate reductase [Clostridia bacterium]
MPQTKVFIDGSAGTTGLKIYDRLSMRNDIHLITLPEELRKTPHARAEAINSSDVTFLCLPDAAADESAGLCVNPSTVIIDTSTAHRTSPDWTYGFPELTGYRERIASSKRIANPGCHASGFVSLIAPLTESCLLPADAIISAYSLTGYSGGGKKMIADYCDSAAAEALLAPRVYGISGRHKHLPEMVKVCGLAREPLFSPIVSSYYSGMEVVISLYREQLNGTASDIKELYRSRYSGKIVKYAEGSDESGFLSASALSGRDDMEIAVFGNDDRITLVSRFDNLGKGASGAAIQNMNIVLGLDETTGLNTGD